MSKRSLTATTTLTSGFVLVTVDLPPGVSLSEPDREFVFDILSRCVMHGALSGERVADVPPEEARGE